MSSDTAVLVPLPQDRVQRTLPLIVTLAFGLTSFLSAFLLFQVQLIVSKYILPWFGGSAAVWTTSMLVFQVLLLCGYIYSHLISTQLSPAAQIRLHLSLLTCAFLLLIVLSFLWPSAITPGAAWKPLQSVGSVREVAVIILASVGLPFFVLATTGPLLQSWFARLGGGVGTYKLYAISNLGSLLGLLTFPFLIEPLLRMKSQGGLWSVLFCVFIAVCGLCAWRASEAPDEYRSDEPTQTVAVEIGAKPFTYALWFLLAACASSLLLATTNLLCQEVTSVPLLWVVPLSLYLVSFILCFDHRRWYKRAIFHPLFVLTLFLTCASRIAYYPLLQLVTLPGVLFLACMICHGELARLKPGVQRLTSFYLAISAGGAAGGIFVGVIAPYVFTSFAEFQISLGVSVVLIVVTLVRDRQSWIFQRDFRLPAGIAGGALLGGYASGHWLPEVSELLKAIRYYPIVLFLGTIVAAGALTMKNADHDEKRGFRFVHILVAGIALSAFFALYKSAQFHPGLYLGARNFYGVIRVFQQSASKALYHGQIAHGEQYDPPMERYPTTYYGPNSGVGVVLQNHPKRSVAPGSLRVGVVGLGAGTLAAYGRPGDYIRYYEIDPDVVKLSSGPEPVFTYIRDSAAQVAVALGDARLSLEREAAQGQRQKFDVLVLDAFSGDAIPVHLLTREAFETYWQHVDPEDGIIAVHITSRHVNLSPVLEGVSAHFRVTNLITLNPRQDPVFQSCWVLLARHPRLLNLPGLGQIAVRPSQQVRARLWTDDYSDIFRLLY